MLCLKTEEHNAKAVSQITAGLRIDILNGAKMYKIGRNVECNIFLTRKLLQVWKKCVPLHPVISFSVINYVVSMRCPTRVAQLIFFASVPMPRSFGEPSLSYSFALMEKFKNTPERRKCQNTKNC